MKKLRLIKPWDLEAIYQKAGVRPEIGEAAPILVCNGPQAPDEEDYRDGRRGPSYIACAYTNTGNPAPVSRPIFAAVSNPRMG